MGAIAAQGRAAPARPRISRVDLLDPVRPRRDVKLAGLTKVEHNRPGIVQQGEDPQRAVGGDQIEVAEAGTATVDRPVGRSFDGQILRQSERVDLAPGGRELDLELGYRLALGARREVSFNWLTRLEPGHRQGAAPDHAAAVRLRTRF